MTRGGKKSCKYYQVCGTVENCKNCSGYTKKESKKIKLESKKFLVEINCENSSYENLEHELISNLKAIIKKIENFQLDGKILDSNGNSTGIFTLKK